MNQKSLLAATFVSVLAMTSVACDDDPKPPPRDAAPDRAPDSGAGGTGGTGGTGGMDAGLDRTAGTGGGGTGGGGMDGGLDRAPDSPDTGADRPPDTTTDQPVDQPVDTMADRAPDTATDLPPDVSVDLPPDTTPDTTADVNPTGLNGCLAYEDRTGAGADRGLTWALTIAADAERCMKVKAGVNVCWSGAFDTHPLAPAGGDTPNPVPSQTAGTVRCVAFPTPGVYGYRCTVHPTMTGAIYVVP